MTATKVADGQAATAAQYNALYDDVHDLAVGHAHSGAADDGKVVSHASLSDGAIGSGKSHADIDAHIGSVAGTGATGVHGLDATAAVMGQLATTHHFAMGNATTDTSIAEGGRSKDVDTGLSSVAGAILTPDVGAEGYTWGIGEYTMEWDVTLDTPSAGHITCRFRRGGGLPNLKFYWLAWGLKS